MQRRLWLIPTAEVPLTNLVRESIVDEDTTAAAADRLHAVLPRRSGRRRQRHPRHDPPAPVHQGRAGLDHHAGEIQRRARAHAGLRRGGAEEARPALPRGHALHRRHGLRRRRRPTTSRSGCRAQNAYREISSCSDCGEFQARRMKARYAGKDGKVKASRPHAQRLRRRGRPRADRGDGNLSARRPTAADRLRCQRSRVRQPVCDGWHSSASRSSERLR